MLKPIPGGATISKAIQKTYKTMGTRPVALGIKLAGIAVSLAFPVVSIPVVLAIAGVSLAATAYNVGKETLEVKDEKLRNAEKKSLENIKESKQTQRKLLENKAQEITGKSSPDLEKFLFHKGSEMYRKPSEEPPEKPFTNTYFKEFTKVCRDSVPGFVSTLAGAAAVAHPVGWVAAGATMVANFLGETDNKLVRMEQKKDAINQINELKAFAPDYTDPKKLPELERQQKINTATLEEFLEKTPNIDKLNQIQLEAAFATKQKEVEARQEFEVPAEKTKAQKLVSGVKEWAGYVADSQFSDLKALHSKKDEKVQDTEVLKKQNSPSPVQSKVQEQVHNMQESLTHGKVTSRSNNISPLPTGRSASKKQESSRGV